MVSLIRQIKSWLLGEKLTHQTPVTHIIRDWDDADIPRYPPFTKGLPAVPVEKIMQTQHELISRIRQSVAVNDDKFNRYYYPVITRFCDYVHLLPASRSHHHRGAGGLFRHCLEVGLYALQAAERVLVDLGKIPSERRETEPRWQMAVFVAALCHDIGKPVTDLTISSIDRSVIWKPIRENLYEWASRCNVNAYFLNWREGRGRQHTSVANLVAERIIGTDALMWMEEGGLELVLWLMESLNDNPSQTNPVYTLVIEADQESVERDLKTIGATMAGYEIGVPVERLLIDIMHRLVKEGIWRVNEPGARVWKIEGNTYVVWPAGGEEIVRFIRNDKIPGLSHTAEGILEMLTERGLIEWPPEEDAPYWYIIPEQLKEKIPGIKLQTIRLNDDSQVSPLPLQQVEGSVFITNDTPLDEAIETTEDSGGTNASVLANETNLDVPEERVIPANSAPEQVSESKLSIPPESKPQKPAVHYTIDSRLMFEDKAGRIMMFLLHGLESTERQWGKDAWLDEEKYLLAKWPESFQGFDLPPKVILEELFAKRWLWVDPVTPWKKVVESQLNGEPTKVIRFEKTISHAFTELLKEYGRVQGFSSDAKVDESMQFGAPQGYENSSSVKGRARETPKEIGRPKNTAEFPTIEELMSVLRSVEAGSKDKEGWFSMDRKLLSSEVRNAGHRCTIVFINKIAKQMPDQFSAEGTIFRWRG